jgi:hypothetical protein
MMWWRPTSASARSGASGTGTATGGSPSTVSRFFTGAPSTKAGGRTGCSRPLRTQPCASISSSSRPPGSTPFASHIKVEPRRYYYHCDSIGMMVWQDQVSAMADNPPWAKLRPDPQTVTWPEGAHAQL